MPRVTLSALKWACKLFPSFRDPATTPFTQAALLRLAIDEAEKKIRRERKVERVAAYEVACELGYSTRRVLQVIKDYP